MRYWSLLLFCLVLFVQSYGQKTVWDEVDSILTAEGIDWSDTLDVEDNIDNDEYAYVNGADEQYNAYQETIDAIYRLEPIKTDELNPIERDVLKYINEVRKDPKGFKDKYLKPTKELRRSKYYKSLVKTLDNIQAQPPLKIDSYLNATAEHHAKDMGKKGYIGHRYSNGKMITDVFNVAECCEYGSTTALDIVLSLLIDEGVPSLGHREEILSPDDTTIGVSFKKHKRYDYCTVIHFR